MRQVLHPKKLSRSLRAALSALLIVGFAFTTAFAQSHLDVAPGITPGNTVPNQNKTAALWDIQKNIDATAATSAAGNAAACWTGTEFWVSRWSTDSLFTLDANGTVTSRFTISGLSGTRSITTDGSNLYIGTASTTIYVVNPATKTVTSTISVANAARYVTYDPTLNSGAGGLWYGNFSTDWYAVSLTGTALTSITATNHTLTSVYGLAYDGFSTGGPYLWAFDQAGSGAVIYQISIATGMPTGISHDVTTDAVGSGTTTPLAGGLFITNSLVTGKNSIGGLCQGTPNKLFAYELADPSGFDMTVTSSGFNNVVYVGNNTVSGVIQNLGATTITSFRLNYRVDGGSIISENKTGLNISTGGTYNFSHGTQWNVPIGGVYHTLEIWADNLNGSNPDANNSNDTLTQTLFAVNGTSGNKKVLIEEFTGAWCGYCPDGAVRLEQIQAAFGNDVAIVSIHSSDGMTYSEGIRTAFNVTAYPGAMVDRVLFDGETKEPHNRGDWQTNTASQMGEYTPVNVMITATYNTSTREINADVTADFVDYAAGDMRILFYVTEDSVTGSGSAYDQVNYYNTTSGHPYFGAGDPIIGYYHRHTLRANPAGAFGNSGVIPSTVSPGGSYTESFSYTLPASYDETKIHLVASVAYNSTTIGERSVLNTNHGELSVLTGANDAAEALNFVQVYPNPASSQAYIKGTLTGNTSIAVYNAMGQKVQEVYQGQLSGESFIPFEVSGLASGIYYVNIQTDAGSVTKKLIIE